jgi:hypothetical protein
MRCIDCVYFQRNELDGSPWCEAWRRSKRIVPGDEVKDLPCSKGNGMRPIDADEEERRRYNG